MTRITNIELKQQLDAALVRIGKHEARIAQLEADVERLQTHLSRVTSVASALNEMRGRGLDPVVESRKAALAAAREIAMRTGRTMKAEFTEPRVQNEEGTPQDLSYLS